MHTMFRFSDPENDGLIDTLELQFLLYLSTKMPKNDDVTLEDCFFMEDDRDGNHVKRIDMQSGYHIARLFDDQIDEVKVRSCCGFVPPPASHQANACRRVAVPTSLVRPRHQQATPAHSGLQEFPRRFHQDVERGQDAAEIRCVARMLDLLHVSLAA